MSKAEFAYQATRDKNWSAGIKRKRKQLNRQKIPLAKKPQAARWLLAALLFFDGIPHNFLSNFRELWGIPSKKDCLSSQIALFRSNYAKRCLLLPFCINLPHSVRGPPLLKS